jgi:RNA polymerase sigma-70 factor, ECF subfamily
VLNNEEYLIREAVNGNQAAFTQIYDIFFDKIFRYVYFRVRKQAEAEDITQEVFIKALRAIASYKMGKTPFASWLFSIAHNQVIDFVRKNNRYQSTSLDEAATVIGTEDPVIETEQKFESEELSFAVSQLSPAQQEVISLRFIAGLPIADVARIANKREGTVKALQFNATLSLRKLLVGKMEWLNQ